MVDDIGISTDGIEEGGEKEIMDKSDSSGGFQLNTNETFELNIAVQQLT
jgi:hypothetical protein